MTPPSRFLNELHVDLKEGSDSVWVLTRPLEYWSESAGLIIVPGGFLTDLASVPRLPIIYYLWGGRAHREAILHDYLFRRNSKPCLPFMKANGVFLEAMASRGVTWHIRYPMYYGVCLGGYGSYHKRKVEDKL